MVSLSSSGRLSLRIYCLRESRVLYFSIIFFMQSSTRNIFKVWLRGNIRKNKSSFIMLSRDLVVFLLVSGTFSLLSLYFTWHLATNYPQDPLNNLIGSRAYLVGLGTHFIFCLGLGYFWTGHLGFVILASVGSELGEWLI